MRSARAHVLFYVAFVVFMPHFQTGQTACAFDRDRPLDEIVGAIRKGGGTVRYEGVCPPPMSITFEAWAGDGFERKEPNPRTIEQGLKALAKLHDYPDVRITLEGTGISDSTLQHIKRLRGITELNILNSKVTDAGMEGLEPLNKLRRLRLSRNRITGSGLSALKNASALESLILHDERISDDSLVAVRQLAHLSCLELQHTEVSDAGLVHLSSLAELRTLTLYRNRIHGNGLGALSKLQRLNALLITEDLTEGGAAGLGSLGAIESLHVAFDRQVIEEVFGQIGRLKHLKRLAVYGPDDPLPGSGDRALAHLGALSALRRLELSSIPIGDEGLARLARLRNLVTLRLQGASATPQGVRKLKESLEWLSVELVY